MAEQVYDSHKCLNCGGKLSSKYCPNCGQERVTGRFMAGTIISQAAGEIFKWDNLFLRTFKQLLTRPGHFVKDYLNGKRKPYVKSFSFFMYFLTINIFVFHWLSGKYISLVVNSINQAAADSVQASLDKVRDIIQAYKNYMYFLLPFIYAFSLKVFLKKRTGINYAESLVFSLYCYAMFLFFNTIILFLSIIDARMMGLSFPVILIYLSIAVMQFSGCSKIRGLLIGGFVTVLSYLIFVVIIYIAIFSFKALFDVHKTLSF